MFAQLGLRNINASILRAFTASNLWLQIAESLMKGFLRVIILFSNGRGRLPTCTSYTYCSENTFKMVSKVRDNELIRWYLGTLQGINAPAESIRPADS